MRRASARRKTGGLTLTRRPRPSRRNNERLYRPPHSADDPDAAGDPVRVVRRGAVCAGRPGGARHRAALWRRHRRQFAHFRRRRRRFWGARPGRRVQRRRRIEVPRRAGAGSGFHQEPGKAVRLRQAGAGTFCADGMEFYALRFRQELFPRCQRAATDQGEAAGLDVAGDLDDALDLSDLDPARDSQGRDGRLEVRHLDLGGDHRRICDPGISVRDPVDHPVRRRLVLQLLPAARIDLGRLVAISLVLENPRLFLAHHAAADLDGVRGLRHHDAADEKFVPRRNPQAICDDRACQGLQPAAGALQSHLPQRHADRDCRFPGRVHSRVFLGLALDRNHLLARWVGPARLRERAEPRLPCSVRNTVHLLACRPCGQSDLRPRLHVDRSADRFRGAGGLMTIIAPPPIETTVQSPLGEIVPVTQHRFSPSPLNRRRWQNFKSNRRGYWSFWIFLILFFVSLFAELIAHDRPFVIKFDGHLYWPAFVSYSETTFGGDFETAADYRDPYLQKLIADKGGTIVWPLIRYSYDTHNLDLPTPAPSKPTWMLTEAQCKEVVVKKHLNSCRALEYNWLGTDDQGRDVVARLIYGFRISVLFGLSLTIISSIIGVAAGGVQGYFGGWLDLGFQRFIEIWSAIPSLYLLLILFSVLVPGFFVLLGILP